MDIRMFKMPSVDFSVPGWEVLEWVRSEEDFTRQNSLTLIRSEGPSIFPVGRKPSATLWPGSDLLWVYDLSVLPYTQFSSPIIDCGQWTFYWIGCGSIKLPHPDISHSAKIKSEQYDIFLCLWSFYLEIIAGFIHETANQPQYVILRQNCHLNMTSFKCYGKNVMEQTSDTLVFTSHSKILWSL